MVEQKFWLSTMVGHFSVAHTTGIFQVVPYTWLLVPILEIQRNHLHFPSITELKNTSETRLMFHHYAGQWCGGGDSFQGAGKSQQTC